jgi:ribosome recycling factor
VRKRALYDGRLVARAGAWTEKEIATKRIAAAGNACGWLPALGATEGTMATTTFDMNDLKRRMQGAIGALKQEMSGLRTGRASTALLDHVQVEAYGTHMPLNQLATISVPEPRLLNVQVWDRSMVHAVEKAISAANLGLTPSTEGQVLRLRIPELNEERRRELVKVAHKYAEGARVAVRHVRRDGLDLLKKLEKDHKISEDEHNRQHDEVQKATDAMIAEVEKLLATKEKEIMTV